MQRNRFAEILAYYHAAQPGTFGSAPLRRVPLVERCMAAIRWVLTAL